MTDARVREAERRLRAGASVADECELLRSRLRLGQLSPERLAVAAYAGHPAARFVLGVDAAPTFTARSLRSDDDALVAWTRAARELGQATTVRAAEAGLRLVLTGRTTAWLRAEQAVALRLALDAIRAWVEGTGLEPSVIPSSRFPLFRRGPAWHCATAVDDLGRAALSVRHYPESTAAALEAADCAARTLGMADPEQVDAAVRGVLLEHALGESESAHLRALSGPR